MACAKLSYNNVTEAAWNCGKQKAASYGVQIDSNKGSVSKSGFTIAWNYDPAAKTVCIQCTDSPMLVPCFVINNAIDSQVEDCLKQHDIKMEAMMA